MDGGGGGAGGGGRGGGGGAIDVKEDSDRVRPPQGVMVLSERRMEEGPRGG